MKKVAMLAGPGIVLAALLLWTRDHTPRLERSRRPAMRVAARSAALPPEVAQVPILPPKRNGLANLSSRDPRLEVAWEDGQRVPGYLIGDLRDADPRSPREVAESFLAENRELFDIGDLGAQLRFNAERSEIESPDTGWSDVWFDQILSGVPVAGRFLRVNVAEDGSVRAVHGRFEPGLEFVSPRPTIDETAVERIIREDLSFYDAFEEFAPPAKIVSLADSSPRLVWETRVTAPGVAMDVRYQIDAESGRIHLKATDTCTLQDPPQLAKTEPTLPGLVWNSKVGSGLDVFGNKLQFPTARRAFGYGSMESGPYYLSDLTRPGAIYGYDQKQSGTWIPWAPIVDADNAWVAPGPTQAAEAAGHFNLGRVMDYHGEVHRRNSWDGKGGDLKVGYHSLISGSKNNASSSPTGRICFGDGDGKLPWTTLDISAHEFTHCVLDSEGVLSGSQEIGAIHESIADTFACFVDHWFNGPEYAYTFINGEDLLPNHQGVVRDLTQPWLWDENGIPYPKHYSSYVGSTKFTGVHKASMIPSYAMVLLVKGGIEPNSGTGVTGIGFEKARRIYYKAITQYLDPGASFWGLREAVLAATVELFGTNSLESKAVIHAFKAVGIVPHYDFIRKASSGGVLWTAGGGETPTWYDANFVFEDGSLGAGIAMVNHDLTAMVPIFLPPARNEFKVRLRSEAGFLGDQWGSPKTKLEISFTPDGAMQPFMWKDVALLDWALTVAVEDLTPWAGKSGVLQVRVVNSGEDPPPFLVWKRLQITYEPTY